MADIRTIEAGKYNKNLAGALKEIPEFKAPEWAFFVKTSSHKVRPTSDENFWHNRSTSILRQIYLRGTVGVERLRTRYGGTKKRGSKPKEFRKSSGNIIRKILQQAESAGLLEKSNDKKGGRKSTEKGRKFLEDAAK